MMIPTNAAAQRYAALIRDGHITLEDALHDYAGHLERIAEAYRKLAEEAIANQVPKIILLSPPSASEAASTSQGGIRCYMKCRLISLDGSKNER